MSNFPKLREPRFNNYTYTLKTLLWFIFSFSIWFSALQKVMFILRAFFQFNKSNCQIRPTFSILINVIVKIKYWSRLEKVKIMSIRSQAKILGTLATVAGAMIMTIVRGPNLDLPWTRAGNVTGHHQGEVNLHHSIKGALMITIGMFCWACFMILQVNNFIITNCKKLYQLIHDIYIKTITSMNM